MERRSATTDPAAIYAFGDCELDVPRRELRRAGAHCPLEPQVFDLLAYLVEQRDRVVAKQELFDHVWKDRFVTEATLSSRVMAARRALGDSGQHQRLIRTVRGYGYRFVGSVEVRAQGAPPPAPGVPRPAGRGEAPTGDATTALVGRDAELAALRRRLATARGGTRQFVFVTGEPGQGKTALIDALVEDARSDPLVRVAWGQCLEHHGSGEAYLPLLEALGRLCRAPGGQEVIDLLDARAPTWLAQMPWLVAPDRFESVRVRAQGVARERMLREFVEVVEALTAERPLVLALDDLQWSDYSTLDLLAFLGRRRETARLLVIGAYRPAELRMRDHPLGAVVRDFRVRGLCSEVSLGPLDRPAVAAYLVARLPGTALPEGLAEAVLRRTGGSPLFVRTVVDAWIAENGGGPDAAGWGGQDLVRLAASVPASLREVIEHQIDRLGPADRDLLVAASAIGREFAAAAVAAAIEVAEEDLEARCEALAQTGIIRGHGVGEWPDGTISASFAFVHDLHREILYERIPPGRKAALHGRIGARLEAAYGATAADAAAELALHFRRGRDSRRAARHLLAAAEQGLRRNAHREAIDHLRAALVESRRLPADADRLRLELDIHDRLVAALVPFKGWAAPEVEHAYARGRELCGQVGDQAQSCRMLFGLATLHEYRGQHRQAETVLADRFRLAETEEDADLLVESHELLACALFHQGAFADALASAERALDVYDPSQRRSLAFLYDEHPAVACHAWAAQALWFLGFPDRGLARMRLALEVAGQVGHLHTLAVAQCQAAVHHHLRGEPAKALAWAEAAATLSADQAFEYRLATATILRGWGRAAVGKPEDGLDTLRDGLRALRASGAEMDLPYFLALLAEVYAWAGRFDEGLTTVAEALAVAGERGRFFNEPELYRLRGRLLIRAEDAGGADEAAACFDRARDLARRLGTPMLELRALIDTATLDRSPSRRAVATALLADAYGRFREGWETADLRAARRSLGEPKPA